MLKLIVWLQNNHLTFWYFILFHFKYFCILKYCKVCFQNIFMHGKQRSSYGPADSVMDSPQVSGSRPGAYGTLSTELLTDYHHINIKKLSVRWCVWKVGEGFPDRVWPKTLKWVVVYSRYSMDSTATGRPRVCILWQNGVSCSVSVAWHSCVPLLQANK